MSTPSMTSTPATLTVTLVDGTEVVVPDSLEQITPYVLQEQGDWFEDEIKFLRRLVQPGQTVVDIGANVGVYALSLARKVGPSGQVWAFEPASTTAELLAESIAANGTTWLQLQRQALSDHTGTAWLQTPGQSELNSLAPDQQGPGEEVPLTTLDACLETFGWQQVDLLKIDAEGEEDRILAGGRRFFAELSPLVMFELKSGTELHLELVERFLALGYDCYRLVPGLDALMPFDPAAGADGYLLNLFAAKADRAEALTAGGWLVPTTSPAPPKPAELAPYHWQRVLTPLPYGQALAASWEEHLGSTQAPAAAEPLALCAYAQDASQPIARRLGALQRSYALFSEQARDKTRLTSLSSLARVAAELGERSAAVRTLGHLIPGLEAAIEPSTTEPFLPPCSRFDRVDPEGGLADWLDAAALESDEILGHFSSYFSGIKARPRLERLQALGFAGTAMQQRLALLNSRYPPRPQATPEIEHADPEQIAAAREAFELIQAGDLERGKQRLVQAEKIGNTCSLALHLIAKSAYKLGDRNKAQALLQRTVDLDPGNAGALLELGICLKENGDRLGGEHLLHQALWIYGLTLSSREPLSSELYNLAIVYQELGDQSQALELFGQALASQPELNSAMHERAKALATDPARHDEALGMWDVILNHNHDHLDAICSRASLLISFGDPDQAIHQLERVLHVRPNESWPHELLAFAHSIQRAKDIQAHLPILRGYWIHQQHLINQPEDTPARPARAWSRNNKIRIGFLVSGLAREQVVNQYLEPFLTYYDRNRFHVELLVKRPIQGNEDHWTHPLIDGVIPLWELKLEPARELLSDRGFHVIVETAGFTKDSDLHLLARRCAPVHCHWIGYHASTGLDTIDWFIGDELTAGEDLADQFVEKLWRLPRPWLACRPPLTLPEAGSNRKGHAPVLGSFNQFAKVRTETLCFWAAVLQRIPKAELHLKNFVTDSARPRQRILDGLSSLGINQQRVVFLPRTELQKEHLAAYQGIDVALDTTPWSGATTTMEALLMGVPVVGIQGDTTAGRMSCSILRAVGHQQWIVDSPKAFAETAAALLEDLEALRAGREGLRRDVLTSPLFDGADLARHLQEAFAAMLARAGAMQSS